MSELQDRNNAGDAPLLERAERSSTPDATDELFSLLSDRRRRRAVAWIGEADEPVALAALASAVAGPESGADHEIGADRARVALAQNHLPKLEDAGVLEFDRERAVVAPGDRLDTILEVLDVVVGAS